MVDLVDEPWQHLPENYCLAITGKAFNLLVSDPTKKVTLQKVLLKS